MGPTIVKRIARSDGHGNLVRVTVAPCDSSSKFAGNNFLFCIAKTWNSRLGVLKRSPVIEEAVRYSV